MNPVNLNPNLLTLFHYRVRLTGCVNLFCHIYGYIIWIYIMEKIGILTNRFFYNIIKNSNYIFLAKWSVQTIFFSCTGREDWQIHNSVVAHLRWISNRQWNVLFLHPHSPTWSAQKVYGIAKKENSEFIPVMLSFLKADGYGSHTVLLYSYLASLLAKKENKDGSATIIKYRLL